MRLLSENNIIFLGETESTNTYLLTSSECLKKDGLVVIAEKQTRGRGQKNRRWESGDNNNLFLSFVLHVNPEKFNNLTLISPLLGLSLIKTFNQFGINDAKIKWPNDILVNKKKIAGILCESTVLDDIRIIVAGIGINLYGKPSGFSEEIRNNVETLENLTGIKHEKQQFINKLISELNNLIEDIKNNHISYLIYEWEKNCHCKDKEISIKKGDKILTGILEGISQQGELIINCEGCMVYIDSGIWFKHCMENA